MVLAAENNDLSYDKVKIDNMQKNKCRLCGD